MIDATEVQGTDLVSVEENNNGLSKEEIEKRLLEGNKKPVLLWIAKSELSVNRSVNKKMLEILVNSPFAAEIAKQTDITKEDLLEAKEELSEDTKKLKSLTAISVSKKIIISDYHKAIHNHDIKTIGEVKKTYSVPPYHRRGLYLIPLAESFAVDEYLTKRMKERQELVEKFLLNYDDVIKAMIDTLEKLFNYQDYPSREQVRSKYNFQYKFFSFDTPVNLKDVNIALFEKQKAESAVYWDKVRKEVGAALTQAYQKLVNHLVEQLSEDEEGNRKRFNSRSIANITDFIDAFANKNTIAENSGLAKLVEDSKSLLAGIDPKLLNTEDSLAKTIKEGFQEIQAGLDANMIELRGDERQFDLGEEKFDLFSSTEEDDDRQIELA